MINQDGKIVMEGVSLTLVEGRGVKAKSGGEAGEGRADEA